MTIHVHATPASLLLFNATTERLVVRRRQLPRAARPRLPSARRYACPICAGPAERMRRTWLDRLVAVLVHLRVRRHRCRDEACGWNGNLHTRPMHAGALIPQRAARRVSR